MTRTRTAIGAFAALALCACQTMFYGAPKVEDGPKGCRKQCDDWDMDLVGMVKMGQFSDGCICQVRPQRPEPGAAPQARGSQPAPGLPAVSVAATGQAIAGVWTQMEQQRQQQQYANQPWAHPSSGAGYHPPVGSTGGWGGGGWR